MSQKNSLFLTGLLFCLLASNHLRIKKLYCGTNIHIHKGESSEGERSIHMNEVSLSPCLGFELCLVLDSPLHPFLAWYCYEARSIRTLGLLEQMLRSQALGSPQGDSSFGHLPALQGRDSFNPGLLRCAPHGSIFKEHKVTDVRDSSTGPWLWCNLCEPWFLSLWSRENNWTWRLIGTTVF